MVERLDLALWIPILAALAPVPVRAQEPTLYDLGSLTREVTARYGPEEIEVGCPGFGAAGPGDAFSCRFSFGECTVEVALQMRDDGRFAETGWEESEGCAAGESGSVVDPIEEMVSRYFGAFDRRAWGEMEALFAESLRSELSQEFFAFWEEDLRDAHGAVVSSEVRRRFERDDGCRQVELAARHDRADVEHLLVLCGKDADWEIVGFEWRVSAKDNVRRRIRGRYLTEDAPEIVVSGCRKPSNAEPPYPLECVYVLEGSRCKITVEAAVEIRDGREVIQFSAIEWSRPCKRYRRERD